MKLKEMRKHAFTLIEVLTVIFIIGLLATLGLYIGSQAMARERDSQRVSDLQNIKNSLELYYLDFRVYPSFKTSVHPNLTARWQLEYGIDIVCQTGQKNQYLVPNYMGNIPEDPRAKLGNVDCNSASDIYGQYLYLAMPDPPDVVTPKTGFYLLARNERLSNVNWNNNSYWDDIRGYNNGTYGLQQPCESTAFRDNPGGCAQNYFVRSSRND